MSHISASLWRARNLHEAALNARDIIEGQSDAKMRRVVGSGTKASGVKLYRRIYATTRGIAKLTLFGKYLIIDDYALALKTSPAGLNRAHVSLSSRIQVHLLYGE